MTMSLNLIAILLSFAMMLTGAGSAGEPAEAARTLLLHNVSVTMNGETVELAPSLKLGAATDGEKAVLDFSLEKDGEVLLPLQLGVSEAGITALAVKSDVAVGVTADAIHALEEQLNAALGQMSGAAADEQNGELMKFIMDEFVPAYVGLIEAAQDEDFVKEMNAKSEQIVYSIVDRGEGEEGTVLVEGDGYPATVYRYSLDSAQMGAVADAVFAADERLANYANALFKMYSLLPAESGLNGIGSYSELMEKTGLKMQMDIVESVSEAEGIKAVDAVMTMDMNDMIQSMVQAAEAGETDGDTQFDVASSDDQVPQISPIVMNIHSVEHGDDKLASVDCDYTVGNVGMSLVVNATDGPSGTDMQMNMDISEDGDYVGGLNMVVAAAKDEETGASSFSMNYSFAIPEQGQIDAVISGVEQADGSSANSVTFSADVNGQSFALSFDLDVLTDAIEDLVNGHEYTAQISDLSEEGLAALGEDQTLQAAAMQAAGSLNLDLQKLMGDESVQQLIALLTSQGAVVEEAVEDAIEEPVEEALDDDYDYTYEIDDDSLEPYVIGDDELESVEDDGVLGFEVPEFTWLPEGWSQLDASLDTAYDWADLTMGDATGENSIYVLFFADSEEGQGNYIVADDGSVTPVEGREITVSDFGDGSISVVLRQAGLYTNIMVSSPDMDMETIGKLIAGIKF